MPDRERRNGPRRCRVVSTAALLTALAGCAAPPPTIDATPRPPTTTLQSMPECCLQALYLRCSKEAMTGRLSRGEIAGCSVVYQTLLERSFGGDFQALHAWSREQPDAPDAGTGCTAD